MPVVTTAENPPMHVVVPRCAGQHRPDPDMARDVSNRAGFQRACGPPPWALEGAGSGTPRPAVRALRSSARRERDADGVAEDRTLMDPVAIRAVAIRSVAIRAERDRRMVAVGAVPLAVAEEVLE